jgi:hypothetical protein
MPNRTTVNEVNAVVAVPTTIPQAQQLTIQKRGAPATAECHVNEQQQQKQGPHQG